MLFVGVERRERLVRPRMASATDERRERKPKPRVEGEGDGEEGEEEGGGGGGGGDVGGRGELLPAIARRLVLVVVVVWYALWALRTAETKRSAVLVDVVTIRWHRKVPAGPWPAVMTYALCSTEVAATMSLKGSSACANLACAVAGVVSPSFWAL